ncbi:hypothetical protein EX895_000666 [Sporisorium graminicola]|uniref:UDENN domain-containing protein n=1 Tax=Sporisorium graminicola TaxID=280036 RepID=A0A4U7L408_9BASI|nr:hypothetical protein EX895_000666 [Sporisorium graminicola]TKY90668.1 hypothetical protein EX895_000666 [Sporisorium graminicola]
MAASHTSPSSPNTGDGDLGLFAMESRSSSTSFDVAREARALALNTELTSIPTHPSSPAADSVYNEATLPPFQASAGPFNNGAPGISTSGSVGMRLNSSVSTSVSPSSLTSSPSISSRLGAMSLQDELSLLATTSETAAGSSTTSPTSPASASSSSTRDVSHNPSHSNSSSSAYTSATESPASDRVPPNLPSPSSVPFETTPAPSVPTQSPGLPSSSVSQRSIASTSTITHARIPTLRSLSGVSADKQAMSVEQELDASTADWDSASVAGTDSDHHLKNNSAALSRRSSRRSRRSGVPALSDRLPVGAGGPQAPPRNTSFRDASKRLSTGQAHGDLGVDAYSHSGVGPSSPSMTSFLDLDSPRTSESSTTGRCPVPSRRTSLRASSPKTATFPLDALGSATGTSKSSSTAAASAAHPYAGMGSSRPKSRPTSTGDKAALSSAASSAKAQSASKTASATTPISTLSFDREAMQRWVLSVGCVNFDLELGPDLEFLYPPLGISREERDNIAFSSFPDTSIFDDGSLVFSWRVREVPLDSSTSEPPTIKSLNDALQQPSSLADEETPRPSMNKAALQNAMAIAQKKKASGAAQDASLPTSPISPSTSGYRDSSASSAASSQSLSRQASDANLRNAGMATLPATPSFHERLTQKLFSSSGPSSMARHFSHDRRSSSHSTSSASASVDDEADAATGSTIATASSGSNASPSASYITTSNSSSTTSSDINSTKRAAAAAAGNSTSSSYIYGYVFFRQKRDPTNRRGYFQKSVVILSHLPLVGLFSEVVARLGPLYFEHGMSMFEAFANDIMSWPPPQPGTILTLPLLGSILTAAIPFGQQPQNSPNAVESTPMLTSLSGSSTHSSGGGGFRTATMTIRSRSRQASSNGGAGNSRELPEPLIGPEGPLLASIPATSLFETFKEALADLWLLWECVLLAEPILVIAPEPKIASEAVWHMLDLIRPIPYAGDFRPYFHIHDYDFRTLVTKNKPQAGTLIASTNPFFATACGHWPHVLRVGKAAVKLITIKHGTGGGSGGGGGGGAGKKGGVVMQGGGIGGGHGAGGGGPDHIPGFTTKRKRRISKDRQLLKRLQDLAASAAKSGGGDEAIQAAISSANVTMRRYFADLTERFLAPLNRYVASLVPASFDLGSPSEVPKIRPFNTTDFLASLKAHGTPLAIRSRSLPTGASVRQSLYLDFLRCPNFSLWLHSRVAAAEEEQRRRYIASLLQGDVTAFGHTRGEIETIDLYSRLVEEIRLVDVQLTSPTEPGPGSRWRTDKPTAGSKAADSSSGSVSGSGRNTPTFSSAGSTTEKRLRDQKHKLMLQLEKLCQTLPDDLRSSLRRPA